MFSANTPSRPCEAAERGANLLAKCGDLPRPGCVSDNGHRRRNAADTHHCVGRGRGMQAARLRTLTPKNTARGLKPCGKVGAADPTVKHHLPRPSATSEPSSVASDGSVHLTVAQTSCHGLHAERTLFVLIIQRIYIYIVNN